LIETLENLSFAKDANLLRENKHTFCEEIERGSFWWLVIRLF